MRKTILFNDNWTFEKEGICEHIALPHTWNAEDGQGTSSYYRGECKYEKEFKRPEITGNEQVYIEFRGVNSSARVLINGKEVITHDGGYSTFRANLTQYLKDENVLTVYADNSPNDRVYPQRADFTFYGGIYRDVYLVIVDEAHFDLDYFGGNGFKVTPTLEGNNASIMFEAFTSSKVTGVSVKVSSMEGNDLGIVDLTYDEVSSCYKGYFSMTDIHRWNGLCDPYLYSATAIAYEGDSETDSVSARFGLREYSFDPEKGFFLNGKNYPLHGVSRHQDRLGVGNALTKEMHAEDMDLILSVGANSIRLAHYQHDQYFYDLCDEKGIVAWAEIPYITVHMPTGRENTISQMKELIVQNYNHASIICWAISNEITLQGVNDDLLENHRILNDLIHEMDPKRVSAMANLFMLETDSPLVTLPDIRGYNLYYGWYVGDMEDNDEWFDKFHEEHPDVVIGLTEYGADSTIKLQSPLPEKGDFTESYQAVYHEHMLKMFETRPYIWGTYVWNMFEFAAAGRNEAGDPGKNHKGLITFDRKVAKDAYYIYKAYWTSEHMIHLCGKRYHDRVEDKTEIKIYTNIEAVKVYVDGVEIGTKNVEHHVAKFEADINGTHNIKAVAVINGQENELLYDEMEITKVSDPNPEYFANSESVHNWFDKKDNEVEAPEGYLSVNSTMAEIQANPQGKAIVDAMMAQMKKSAVGGMGEGVQMSPAIQQMIARQPLIKLIAQGGFDADSDVVKQLNAALNKIKK